MSIEVAEWLIQLFADQCIHSSSSEARKGLKQQILNLTAHMTCKLLPSAGHRNRECMLFKAVFQDSMTG